MKFCKLIAVCLAGAVLLSAVGCTDKNPKMEVPETDTVVFRQMKQVDMEGWNDAQQELAAAPVRHEIQLPTGDAAALYALDTGEAPSVGANEITSVSADMVLNSSAVMLGQHGTVLELAESELYRWANSTEFSAVQYTQPLKISDKRYMVYLRLDNQKIGMEQYVIYTDLGGGLARIDRLWRAIPDITAVTDSVVLERTVDYLTSNETI